MRCPHFVQRHGPNYRVGARLPVRFWNFLDRAFKNGFSFSAPGGGWEDPFYRA